MEVAMPLTGSAMDCYEDMFKEITRKLYGEDGLQEMSASHQAASDRLQSSGQQERSSVSAVDYEADAPNLKPEEHLTAFGLAALMQNGFPPTGILNSQFPHHHSQHKPGTPVYEDRWVTSEDTLQWTQSKVASYNAAQRLFKCYECDCVGYLPRVAEHWLGSHSNLRTFRCTQCPYESAWARCVRMHLSRQHNINTDDASDTFTKNNPVLQEITKYLQRLKNKLENDYTKPAQQSSQLLDNFPSSSNSVSRVASQSSTNNAADQAGANKRYSCTYCPYATDRRDLFTRHENIHREEKPFQCYVCQKQFNRADHVKKHFLRMHREHPYDLNRIRRHPPKNASGLSYYQKYNSNGSSPPDSISTLTSLHSLSIPNGFSNLTRSSSVSSRPNSSSDIKSSGIPSKSTAVSSKNSHKKKSEKRFTCCYCSWSGVDNWCLKRHMNTHLKPFVCGLCDYKAARSERLATHVLKVHNKRACGKCNFLADDPVQLTIHQQEHHPLEQRHRSGNHVLRTTSFNSTLQSPSCSENQSSSTSKSQHESLAASLLQHSSSGGGSGGNHHLLHPDTNNGKAWKGHSARHHGAARLFNYLEASDGSDHECGQQPPSGSEGNSNRQQQTAEDMSRLALTHRIHSDFPEAGDAVASQPEDEGGDIELPLFVCRSCGCEFEDDISLETHLFTHRHRTASPANTTSKPPTNTVADEASKENFNPAGADHNNRHHYLHHGQHRNGANRPLAVCPTSTTGTSKYRCRLCDAPFDTQIAVMAHMISHSTLHHSSSSASISNSSRHRQRKQTRPQKLVVPVWDGDELEVLRRMKGKLRRLRNARPSSGIKLSDKYMARLVTRRGLWCTWCRSPGLARYHTRGSLALHHYWRHRGNRGRRFHCEHCDATFRHRYQTVLHASRAHAPGARQAHSSWQPPKDTTATLPPVIVPQDSHYFFSNPQAIGVPEPSASSHKLSLFDHSFIHSAAAATSINSHMPIIIPTFPPN